MTGEKTGPAEQWGDRIRQAYEDADAQLRTEYDRSLPFQDAMFDRWERARKLGFGDKTSIYNSAVIFGSVFGREGNLDRSVCRVGRCGRRHSHREHRFDFMRCPYLYARHDCLGLERWCNRPAAWCRFDRRSLLHRQPERHNRGRHHRGRMRHCG